MCNALHHFVGCNCGFGTGSGVVSKGESTDKSLFYQSFENFCQPRKCQYCQKWIYFVSHNGGFVWFDSLGKPWPKHICKESEKLQTFANRKTHNIIDLWNEKFCDCILGVVTEVTQNSPRGNFVVVTSLDESSYILRIHVSFSIDRFLGEFVVMSMQTHKLIRPFLSTTTIISTSEEHILKRRNLDDNTTSANIVRSRVQDYTCTYCGDSFPDSESLYHHFRNHPEYKCPHCPFTVISRQTYRDHLFTMHGGYKPQLPNKQLR